MTKKTISVRLVKSLSGRKPNHILCAKALGLRRLNHEVHVEDTQPTRGLIRKIQYLLQVTE